MLVIASIPVFILVEALLWLAVPGLPQLLAQLGAAMLLTAFILLVISALLGIAKTVAHSISEYLSSKKRAQRRLLFAQSRYDQIKRLHFFKMLQLKYFNEQSRKQLLMINNRKHSLLLSKIIDKELLSIKRSIPDEAFKQLQQENIRYRDQQDIEALLKLQKKIATIL